MTNNTSTERSKRFPGLRTIAGGVVFAAALAVTLGAAPSRDTPTEPARIPVDLSAVAAWANANGLHGFSPTSLSAAPERRNDVQDQGHVMAAQLAEWARANDMTGLSPVSLTPIEG